MSATALKVSLVLLGEFKPDNFLLHKLAEGRVISKKVAESASVIALLPMQTVQYDLGWAILTVVRNKFQIISSEAPHIRICDLVLKALGDLAPDSTVSQFGINVESHHDFGSFKARNEFGCRIAPPAAWGSWGKTLQASMEGDDCGTSLQGGAMSVHMRMPFAEGGLTGWRDVVVEPSPDIKTGVYIRSNHHHQLTSPDPEAEKSEQSLSTPEATSFLLTALSNRFEKSIEDAVSIFDGVFHEHSS